MAPAARTSIGPAAIVVAAGVVAALNYGKLPPALSAIQHEFSLTLVESSWMVSLFMFAAVLFGIAGGSIADRFGPRQVMAVGLLISAASSALGALASTPAVLFSSRAVESLGLLLTVLPGPALLRQCVPAMSLRGWLGIWGAYMPAGMSLALVATPWLMALGGWRLAWWIAAIASLAWAAMIAFRLPGAVFRARTRGYPDHAREATEARASTPVSTMQAATARLPTLVESTVATVRSAGPWLLSLCFLFYAGQFVAIFSFLPSIYAEAGIGAGVGALLTAIGVLANVVGNLASGVLLQRGWHRSSLIAFAGCAMAFTAWIAFGTGLAFALRFGAIVVLSAVGGLIPGTLFASAPFYAPNPSAVSTTVGLMQQGSAAGQIALPPLVALLAQRSGGWSATWLATGAAALVTVAIACAIERHDRRSPIGPH